MKRLMAWLTAWPLMLLAGGALLLCCCSSQWLPDSSGFVMVSTQGEVILFDIESKTERVVVKGLSGTTISGVAVTPDSKRVAVASMFSAKERTDLTLRICSLDGQLIKQSEKLALPISKEGNEFSGTACYWSPDGKYVLICQVGGAFSAISYEVDTGKIQRYQSLLPVGMLGTPSLMIRPTDPFIPGGSGFLAMEVTEGGPPQLAMPQVRHYALSDDASEPSEVFAYTPAARRKFEDIVGAPAEEEVSLPARWSEGKLWLTRPQGYMVIDPAAQTIDYQTDPAIEKLVKYAQQHEVQVVERFGEDRVVQLAGPRVEIAELATGAVRGVVTLPAAKSPLLTLSVAPNRQYLLVHLLLPGPSYWVLDAEGQQLHRGGIASRE